MKKLTIITNGTLPIPASKGGAAENLLETFLLINEDYNFFDITVFTIFDYDAFVLSNKYINSKFVFIKSESILYKLGRGFRFILNKIRKGTLKNQFIHEVTKYKRIIEKSDIILIECNPNFLPIIRKITNKPLGLHLHNDYLSYDNSIYSKKNLNRINFVIGVSEYIKKRVVEIAPKSCRVDFVYNGINISKFCKTSNQLERIKNRSKYGILSDEKVILFTGRIQESKGVDLLLDIFLEIPKTLNSKLLIVGSSGFASSSKTEFIRKLEIKSKKLGNKVVFTGYIDYSDIQEIYNIADIAVYPSLATEAFPLTIVEALASGLPVICTDAGGMPEAINNKCGIVVERDLNLKENIKIQIEKLITDDLLRSQMSDEAIKRAQEFSDIKYFHKLSSFINTIK